MLLTGMFRKSRAIPSGTADRSDGAANSLPEGSAASLQFLPADDVCCRAEMYSRARERKAGTSFRSPSMRQYMPRAFAWGPLPAQLVRSPKSTTAASVNPNRVRSPRGSLGSEMNELSHRTERHPVAPDMKSRLQTGQLLQPLLTRLEPDFRSFDERPLSLRHSIPPDPF